MEKKYVILENPELKEAAEAFNNLKRTHVITIFLNCQVDYKGRAKSKLEWGDKLLISKPDGTLMIHGKVKREPINWQPPGSVSIAKIEEDLLVIRSFRLNPKEILIVRSPIVYVFSAYRMDLTRFMLWDSEADMIDTVMSNPHLIEEGFHVMGKEVQTPYGKIDLLGADKEGNIMILEFKRSTAQLEAVSQLKRYYDYFNSLGHEKLRGILVAPAITSSAFKLLRQYGFEFKQMKPTVSKKKKPNIELLR